jgi:hypothetical protein
VIIDPDAMNLDRGLDPKDLDLFSERPDSSKFIIEDGKKIRIEDSKYKDYIFFEEYIKAQDQSSNK